MHGMQWNDDEVNVTFHLCMHQQQEPFPISLRSVIQTNLDFLCFFFVLLLSCQNILIDTDFDILKYIKKILIYQHQYIFNAQQQMTVLKNSIKNLNSTWITHEAIWFRPVLHRYNLA